ncbi:MAG: hypothetical protein JGK03_06795 [Microcoleus sp. PH2017_25_DOB_D_A]|uniref:hypothetical protein n=1 Tax=unclassified Microcoleus TaxID=2642155 RepID=UPI001D7E0EBA|nr:MULTISPECIES: hypothetical protein [unclassified Microcoleus]TAE44391.1 MAG: hypothetical protein EAZ90_06520 [Oscillatoriales cyanobacterium]MCC3516331.1 hypothetical protein [Microcoleus sp. PH2017_18_LLB_O_A]MCC3533905.1 hypothetical protein [Microcoleus sp. PH2017_25_DOB_D_A]MCC3546016.1 hypothetical protein [Microcoleus sp. PH2017_24_DOB_U_A]TAF60071.1 MAG: hypothetical protein EAZ59_26865 [Oscillatoriales cyanobacterium]
MLSKTLIRNFTLAFLIAIGLELLGPTTTFAQNIATIKFSGTAAGVSTRYIGAVEGNINFDLKDLQDLGINTYRIYGGMSRWEPEDDDGKYGWPEISQIKANPNIINWAHWDKIMTDPPRGSDYSWSGERGKVWEGNARTIFNALKQAKIRPVVSIRNVDSSWNPSWALQLNPPRTKEDWNEWWEHVFATVYWLNVRNDYRVDDWEIHNEPDYRIQGWGGTMADYFELVKVTKDAIDFVYKSYLPGRAYRIHSPTSVGGSIWPAEALREIPNYFDTVNFHNYDADISNYTRKVRGWMKGTVRANSEVWVGEWGSYQISYNDFPLALSLIKNLIRGSQPGDNYIYGSHIFCLYDWGKPALAEGLLGDGGKRRASYYALRMGIRALQGGRASFFPIANSSDLMAVATLDSSKNVYLLAVNDRAKSYTVRADISALIEAGNGTVREFSLKSMDEVVSSLTLKGGKATFLVPGKSAILIKFVSAALEEDRPN